METRTIEEILELPKDYDGLNIAEAAIYLEKIDFKIKIKTIQHRLSIGTGPAVYKRGGRVYFRKADLDAWKRHETHRREAYERAV